jgi:hypothetical protein
MDPIAISAKRAATLLGLLLLLLVAASLGASYLSFTAVQDPFLQQVSKSLVRLTWVDVEGNIPTWYSASLLLLCALLLAFIAAAQRGREHEPKRGWAMLSFIFGILSLDETAQLHELSIAPLQRLFHATGWFYYAWIVPAGFAVAVLVLGYVRFLGRLRVRTRRLFLLAGGIFLSGALGIEAVSGRQAYLHGEHNLTYHLIITAEELFEMTGVIIFIYALLDYIGHRFDRLVIHVFD